MSIKGPARARRGKTSHAGLNGTATLGREWRCGNIFTALIFNFRLRRVTLKTFPPVPEVRDRQSSSILFNGSQQYCFHKRTAYLKPTLPHLRHMNFCSLGGGALLPARTGFHSWTCLIDSTGVPHFGQTFPPSGIVASHSMHLSIAIFYPFTCFVALPAQGPERLNYSRNLFLRNSAFMYIKFISGSKVNRNVEKCQENGFFTSGYGRIKTVAGQDAGALITEITSLAVLCQTGLKNYIQALPCILLNSRARAVQPGNIPERCRKTRQTCYIRPGLFPGSWLLPLPLY